MNKLITASDYWMAYPLTLMLAVSFCIIASMIPVEKLTRRGWREVTLFLVGLMFLAYGVLSQYLQGFDAERAVEYYGLWGEALYLFVMFVAIVTMIERAISIKEKRLERKHGKEWR